MPNKYSFLAKNIFYLLISSFSTKLLSFFLVPLYTSVLTTQEYGSYDFFYTTISLLVPILTVEIMAAVFIFAVDEKYDKKVVFFIACKYIIGSSLLVLAFLVINAKIEIVSIINDYSLYFFFMYFVTACSGVLLEFTRALGKMLDISIASAISSFTIIFLNILFLLVFKWEIEGYFSANILGVFAQNIFLFIRGRFWRYISLKKKNKTVQKEMLTYSTPLITNSISWWINSASDRYIVIAICGLAENGIYSVASKIPSILNIFQTIFSQAWTLSAIKEFDKDDKSGFFSTMYNAYNFVLVFACSGIIAFDRILAKFLYANDFYSAWRYVPFLTIAIIFGSLSGFIGSMFSAMKNSKILAKSTVAGAVANIVMNIVLVPIFGALGAAIATTLSYWLVWFVRVKHIKKHVNIRFKTIRDNLAYVLLLFQSVMLLFFTEDTILVWGIHLIILMILSVLFKEELILWISKIKKKVLEKYK